MFSEPATHRTATDDTIFAPATAPGRAGVAVLRISGPQAFPICASLGASVPAPRLATLARLRHPVTHETIDQGLLLAFPAPHSFTGEDVLELHLHGSRAVMAEMLDVLSTLPGMRLAEPGEFSKRAFMSGKFDLTAAEGLADLIDAETVAQKRQALRLMQGENARTYDALRHHVITVLALLEAYIDFPDEDIPASVLEDVTARIERLIQDITDLLTDEQRGEKIREGLHAVILGAPNVGKSSLLNWLARRDVAIVSEHAGTTRDVLEVTLELGGYALTLADTAGLRESQDTIELEGITRARARAKEADIKLVLFDAAQWPLTDPESLSLVDDTSIVLLSRADRLGEDLPLPTIRGQMALPISTMTGHGLSLLLTSLTQQVEDRLTGEAPLITRTRHRIALHGALHHLHNVTPTLPLELQCEELRRTAQEIGKITGKIDVDAVLDVIFLNFCIGK